MITIGILIFLLLLALFVGAVLFSPSANQAATMTAQAVAALPTLAVLPSATSFDSTALANQISDAETRAAAVNDTLSANIARATQFELSLNAPSLAPSMISGSADITQVAFAQTPEQTHILTDIPSVPFTPTNTLTPSETITDTITPSSTSTVTSTPIPSATPTPVPIPISMTLYAQGSVNVRNCPHKNCTLIDSLSNGEAVSVDAKTDGDEIRSGNSVWYRIKIAGLEGYVYSDYFTDQVPPTAPPPPAAPMTFQGTQAQVIGPLTIPAGLYRARVTTAGFFVAELQVTQGNCGSTTYGMLLPLLFDEMEGQANGAEAILQSEGCVTFIQVTNVNAAWTLQITQIG